MQARVRSHRCRLKKSQIASVDAYIAACSEDVQPVLERVRAAIRKAVPKADESISYQIPSYKLDGEIVLYFAGWKHHFSVYPATDGVVEAFADELARYEISKGTIRFPLSEPVPVGLLARLAKFRAKLAAARAKEKALAKKSARTSHRAAAK